jgi:predicted outer membrane repeat protein
MAIESVEFTQNTAVGYGGGIVAESCFLSVDSSKFNKNKANSGAGIRVLNMKDQYGNSVTPLQIANNFKNGANEFAGNVA